MYSAKWDERYPGGDDVPKRTEEYEKTEKFVSYAGEEIPIYAKVDERCRPSLWAEVAYAKVEYDLQTNDLIEILPVAPSEAKYWDEYFVSYLVREGYFNLFYETDSEMFYVGQEIRSKAAKKAASEITAQHQPKTNGQVWRVYSDGSTITVELGVQGLNIKTITERKFDIWEDSLFSSKDAEEMLAEGDVFAEKQQRQYKQKREDNESLWESLNEITTTLRERGIPCKMAEGKHWCDSHSPRIYLLMRGTPRYWYTIEEAVDVKKGIAEIWRIHTKPKLKPRK